MQNTYDFTIKYEGTKAKRFMPGPVSYGDHDMLALLRNDLKSLGVNLPKRENVHIRRGGVVAVTTLRDTGVSCAVIQIQHPAKSSNLPCKGSIHTIQGGFGRFFSRYDDPEETAIDVSGSHKYCSFF